MSVPRKKPQKAVISNSKRKELDRLREDNERAQKAIRDMREKLQLAHNKPTQFDEDLKKYDKYLHDLDTYEAIKGIVAEQKDERAVRYPKPIEQRFEEAYGEIRRFEEAYGEIRNTLKLTQKPYADKIIYNIYNQDTIDDVQNIPPANPRFITAEMLRGDAEYVRRLKPLAPFPEVKAEDPQDQENIDNMAVPNPYPTPDSYPNNKNRTFFYVQNLDNPPRNYDNGQPEYGEYNQTVPAAANLVASWTQRGYHAPVIDFDFPIEVVPSTTPGHFHLYIDKEIDWNAYTKILEALANAGLVQQGWVNASVARGFTSVRPPWVKKGELPYAARVNLLTQEDDILAADDQQINDNQARRTINILKTALEQERQTSAKFADDLAASQATINDLRAELEYLQNNQASTQAVISWR